MPSVPTVPTFMQGFTIGAALYFLRDLHRRTKPARDSVNNRSWHQRERGQKNWFCIQIDLLQRVK